MVCWTYNFRFERGLNIAWFDLLPIDASEKGMFFDFALAVRWMTTQTVLRIFRHQLKARRIDWFERESWRASVSWARNDVRLCTSIRLRRTSIWDRIRDGQWWNWRVLLHLRHRTAAVQRAFRRAELRTPTNPHFCHIFDTKWSTRSNQSDRFIDQWPTSGAM